MIKDILLPITGTTGDDVALDSAMALTRDLGAHLSVLQVINLPMPVVGPMGVSADHLLGELYAELRKQGADQATRLRSRLEANGIPYELRVEETILGDPPRPLVLHGRYADLSVLPGPGAKDADQALRFFNSHLFESGRPVLVVPASPHAWKRPVHAVVAWQPTREATRALHDALPLLLRCRTVDVVIVDPKVGGIRHGEEPGTDIATHLARHGLQVNVVSLPSAGGTVARVVLRHCAESDAQLLVAGGYGHSRTREWILGGTTRDLLETSTIPVLFSH